MNRASARWLKHKAGLFGTFLSAVSLLPFTYSLLPSAMAADTLRLTLDGALRAAYELGPSAAQARFDSVASEATYRATWGGLLPQLRLTGDTPNWWKSIDERLIYDPETGTNVLTQIPTEERRNQGRLSLSQELPWGASLDVSSRLYRRFWFWDHPEGAIRFTDYSLANRVDLTQPLFDGNPTGRLKRTAEIGRATGSIDHTLRMRSVRYDVAGAFYGLVSAREELAIAERDLAAGRDAADLAQRKLNAGLIPEVEVLQIEVDVARREASYRNSEGAVRAAEDQLKLALGMPLDGRIIQPDFAFSDEIPDDAPVPVSVDNRLEVTRSELALERSAIETRAAVRQARIRAYLSLFYETDSRRRSLDSLDLPSTRNTGVFLHFEVPLYGFGSTSYRIEALRAGQRAAEIASRDARSRVEAEQREALRRLDRVRDRCRIAAAALDLSERSFKITSARFEAGLVSSRELLDAQLDLTRTRRDLLSARIDLELALENLRRMTDD
ncbi:MAG: TolC family protein [Calditrichaeota bacterium]|nr:TolC family protein [Calditrichota bacterium]